MKKIIFVLCFISLFKTLAQSDSTTHLGNSDEIFTQVEEPASFPGGIDGFYQFLAKNLRYPRSAQRMGIEGRVFVQFVVEKDGSITGVKIVKGIGAGCDKEVLRIMRMMPNWIPARQKGKAVRQIMVQNILFKFQNNSSFGNQPHYVANGRINSIDTLGYNANPEHFENVVPFGNIELALTGASFIPLIDTNSYFAKPQNGFSFYSKEFKETLLNDPSYHEVDTKTSVSFTIDESGDLQNFYLGGTPHPNDTAIVRSLMVLGKWTPANRLGVPTKQTIELKIVSFLGEVFDEVDVPATEPEDFIRFLNLNLRYPYPAQRNDIKGIVTASFIVEKDGTITQGKIIEGIGYGCDEEVLKVIAQMPNWTPAFHNGQKVRQRITRRFPFRMND
ncbi:energy transducer TonB [Ekhidna sp.]|uniref:energy transducer TonB n=1 Tax=Ekhidna sp. TaxID=2608089 RepID=UPI003B595FC2